MALDHALAVSLSEGAGAVRFYRWDRPTVSLGRHEPGRGRWDPARLEARGVGLVRRPTGGRAVLHHRELTYAVVLEGWGAGSMRALYAAVNRGLVAGLRSLGVAADTAPRVGPEAAPDAGPCFERPAEGEVVVGGRKLVGSAQVRIEGRLLQHGSVLIGNDQLLLADLSAAGDPDPTAVAGVTCLADWLDPVPDTGHLAEVLGCALETELGGHWHPADTEPTLDADLVARLEDHYRSPGWTWRC